MPAAAAESCTSRRRLQLPSVREPPSSWSARFPLPPRICATGAAGSSDQKPLSKPACSTQSPSANRSCEPNQCSRGASREPTSTSTTGADPAPNCFRTERAAPPACGTKLAKSTSKSLTVMKTSKESSWPTHPPGRRSCFSLNRRGTWSSRPLRKCFSKSVTARSTATLLVAAFIVAACRHSKPKRAWVDHENSGRGAYSSSSHAALAPAPAAPTLAAEMLRRKCPHTPPTRDHHLSHDGHRRRRKRPFSASRRPSCKCHCRWRASQKIRAPLLPRAMM